MTREELLEILENRDRLKRLDLSHQTFENIDFSNMMLKNIDFSWCDFVNCKFDHADFSYSSLEGAFLPDSSLRQANFSHANLEGVNMRSCDLTGADFSSAFLKLAVFEEAVMQDLIANDETQFYYQCCPEKGAFIGYKHCFNDRVVTLLIPEDARRTSCTFIFCRTDKAKVLKISNVDETQEYDEAISYVDQNFIYRKGEMVYAGNFNPDRWRDSTGGIHFFMKREDAIKYMQRNF